MLRAVLILVFVWAGAARADMVVATQVIRANSIIPASAITVRSGSSPGVHSDPALVVGQEARTSIYPGRPVRLGDIGAPALVERNQLVILTYVTAGLEITTDGRSLSRGGAGERVRVMNLSSRSTVTGVVMPDGTIAVSN